MNESKLIEAMREAVKQELCFQANEEIEKAKRRMENRLQHEKDIIIGKVLNHLDIMVQEQRPFEDLNITVVFKKGRSEEDG